MTELYKVGEFVVMTYEELNNQIDNINNILLEKKMLLKYKIYNGEKQLVAGMNYKILIKYYKKIYLIEYFISLKNEILNIKINKLKIKHNCIENKIIPEIFVNETFSL